MIARLSRSGSISGRYLLGVLLGFMPCGLIVSALMAASTAETFVGAGVAMAAFGVGDAIFDGRCWQRVFENKIPKLMNKVNRGFATISALWLFVMAGVFDVKEKR